MMALNPVVISVALTLVMCVLRINVVIALTTGAISCGLASGLSFHESSLIFSQGLGGGAKIALSYAILGAFASALAHSGMPNFLMSKFAHHLHLHTQNQQSKFVITKKLRIAKGLLFLAIGLMAVACKNIIPVHIAFIPILIPPLLEVFNKMQVDRRFVACLITFGLIVSFMLIPVGFGEIFLENILSHYLNINGLIISTRDIIMALSFPAIGMAIGLLMAFFRYKKPRTYKASAIAKPEKDEEFSKRDLFVSFLAVASALTVQILLRDIILSALSGFLFLSLGGIVRRKDADNVVASGFKMMAVISFTMIASAGFGHILKESRGINEIVTWIAEHTFNNKGFAAFSMLLVGFLISVGIGSSFSTVPIVASVYVPLGIKLGFSPAAIIVIIAVSGVTGDASSPASDSTLGPTMGLNADDQHSLIKDTTIPTFLHLTIPAFIFGWLAAVIL